MNQKIIAITGCSKKDGVGYNLANELLKRGHKVIATVRKLQSSELQKKTSSNPDNLELKHLDLYDQNSIDSFIKEVLTEYGYIDVLVNNAAEVMVGAVETATQEDIKTTYQTIVFGPIALIQGFLPSMRKRKQGLITTTSSIFATKAFIPPGFPIYASALCAFERIQENLAIELAKWNINVINFQPGPIKTSLCKHEGSKNDNVKELYKNYQETVYSWYRNEAQWQTAAEVAKVFADIIETEDPDFTYQSNQYGTDYVKESRSDTTGNSYRQEWLDYIKNRV